ncbi:MAG: hypothetical protein ACAI35_11435 [Candidatus Methylacidiphilales bacterium]
MPCNILSACILRGRSFGLLRSRAGFSLVEIMLAVGIFAFAGVALIGLFSIGLNTNRDSAANLHAATIAEFMLSTRRATPTAPLASFPLPRLDVAAKNDITIMLNSNGLETTQPSDAKFGLYYTITPPADLSTGIAKATHVHLYLFWPATATVESAYGRYEVVTSISLP